MLSTPDANSPFALKEETVYQAVRFNSEVQAMTRLTQVADRCAPADAVRVIKRERTHPRRVRVVVVGTIRIASIPRRVVEGRLFRV